MDLYCIRCGTRLGTENGHMVCMNCDTIYSNILLSETQSEDEHAFSFETSISMDCVHMKQKPINLLEVPAVPLAHAAVYE